MVVYRRGRVWQTVRAVLRILIATTFVWCFFFFLDPYRDVVTLGIIWPLTALVVLGGVIRAFRRAPWLIRTSYHGIDLGVEGVRLPWMAITSIYVTGEKLIVTVGDPAVPESLHRPQNNGRLWAKTTFQVVTPEIKEVLADLAVRLPHLEVKHR